MTAGILAREGAILAILVVLGLGPATLLPRSWGITIRLALTPALGLTIGAVVLTTVSFAMPLRHALWLVVLPLAAASVALTLQHHRTRSRQSIERREIAALIALAIWSLGVFSFPMLARQSYGPMGFGIFDAPGYGTEIYGYARNTTRHPVGISPRDFQSSRYDNEAWGKPWDLTSRYAWGFVYQHTAATTIPASLTTPLRWPAWTLVTPFMAVLLATATIGVFALALLVLDGCLWAGCLSALLTAGPALLQVYIDGSLGLLAGLALVPAAFVSLYWLLEGGGRAAMVSLGFLLAGLQAIYPEFLPLVGATIALAWLVMGRPSPIRSSRWKLACSLLGAAGLGAVLSPRTLPWTADYLLRVATHRLIDLTGLVRYNMRPRYLFGWLFQTRDFYTFAFSNPGGLIELWWGLVVPLIGIGVVVIGLLLRRRLLVLAGLIPASVLQALLGQRSDCPYCVQRSFLIVPIVLPILVAGGLLALSTRSRGRRATAAGLAVLLVGTGGILLKTERRGVDEAYLPRRSLIAMVDRARHLPDDGSPLHLEGFDSVELWSWADVPTIYMALRELGRRLSIVAAYNEYGGLAYPHTRPIGHPAFAPDYGWVLTRFGALDAGRETIARWGPLALQKRSRPFDVTLARGASADIDDPTGTPWAAPTGRHFGLIQGPLTGWVSGPPTGNAWVDVRLRGPAGLSIDGPPGTTTRSGPDGVLVGCLPVPEQAALRIVTFGVRPEPPDFIPPTRGRPPVYRPPHSVELLTLRAYDRPCPG